MKLLIAAHRADETEFYERYNQELGYSIDFWEKPLTLENVDRVRGCEAVAINAGCAVDRAMAQALRDGKLGVMDYYNMQNINADTQMRESIATPHTGDSKIER